jgi:hypothetical protein
LTAVHSDSISLQTKCQTVIICSYFLLEIHSLFTMSCKMFWTADDSVFIIQIECEFNSLTKRARYLYLILTEPYLLFIENVLYVRSSVWGNHLVFLFVCKTLQISP